jgi:outer membrane protein OmpA-like peptidoglycan-associated protein
MRWLVCGILCCALANDASAQWYGGYAPPPPPSYYYVPYANPNVVMYSPPLPPPPVVVTTPSRPITYMIGFKNSVVDLAESYWVTGDTLSYITPDHRRRTVPLDTVDLALSTNLNSEQNVAFYVPVGRGPGPLRVRLEGQLAAVLDTRTSPRGLIVNISDVLFDFNQYTLTPGAREKLAKIAGILLAYTGLCPRLEGYTDDIGDDAYNLRLSKMRAEAVRDYLVSQGVPPASLTAVGLGRAAPVASNSTAAGRQQNRRVEMVIPGDLTGNVITLAPPD